MTLLYFYYRLSSSSPFDTFIVPTINDATGAYQKAYHDIQFSKTRRFTIYESKNLEIIVKNRNAVTCEEQLTNKTVV